MLDTNYDIHLKQCTNYNQRRSLGPRYPRGAAPLGGGILPPPAQSFLDKQAETSPKSSRRLKSKGKTAPNLNVTKQLD